MLNHDRSAGELVVVRLEALSCYGTGRRTPFKNGWTLPNGVGDNFSDAGV
jgi:hypothetical protein